MHVTTILVFAVIVTIAGIPGYAADLKSLDAVQPRDYVPLSNSAVKQPEKQAPVKKRGKSGGRKVAKPRKEVLPRKDDALSERDDPKKASVVKNLARNPEKRVKASPVRDNEAAKDQPLQSRSLIRRPLNTAPNTGSFSLKQKILEEPGSHPIPVPREPELKELAVKPPEKSPGPGSANLLGGSNEPEPVAIAIPAYQDYTGHPRPTDCLTLDCQNRSDAGSGSRDVLIFPLEPLGPLSTPFVAPGDAFNSSVWLRNGPDRSPLSSDPPVRTDIPMAAENPIGSDEPVSAAPFFKGYRPQFYFDDKSYACCACVPVCGCGMCEVAE